MDRKIAITAAAVSLAAVYGTADAASPGPRNTGAAATTAAFALGVADQREIIAPPFNIDPDMVRTPPETGARMPVITPPGLSGGGRFGSRG
jgi:hypothetical protein